VPIKTLSASDIARPFVAKVLEFLHCATTPSSVSDSEESDNSEESEDSKESEDSEEFEDYMEPSYGIRCKTGKISPYTQKHVRIQSASRKGVQTRKLEKRVDKGKKH
jgi:hypothetical protein